MEPRRTLLRSLLLMAAGWLPGRAQATARAKVVRKEALSGTLAGMEATLVEVTYPPGVQSAEHRHPGFILGYVVEGKFRFAINGESPRELLPGESFFEPVGSVHSTSANALPDKPTKIVAFMVAPAGSPVTQPK